MTEQKIKLLFSVNEYDYEGDVYEKGVYLHIGDYIKLKFENPDALKDFGKKIQGMAEGEQLAEAWLYSN